MSEKLLDYLKRIVYLGGIFSTIFLFLNGIEILDILWTLAIIPAVVSILIIPICTHLLIVLKCKVDNFSLMLLQFCSINMAIFLSLCLILICLKADEKISSSWCSLFICLWYLILIYILFCVFIVPGLFRVNMEREAYLIIIWGICISITIILMPIWKDNDLNNKWIVIIPIGIAIIYSVIRHIIDVIKDYSNLGKETIFYVFKILITIVYECCPFGWAFLVIAIFLLLLLIVSEIRSQQEAYKHL